jgi:hypothetical protein
MHHHHLRLRAAIVLPLAMAACHSDKTEDSDPPGQAAALRSSPLPPPTASAPLAPMPDERPRFAWHAPLSVSIDETGGFKGRQIRSRYWLDACPAKDGAMLMTRRDLQLVAINNAPPPAKLAAKIDGAAEGLPDFTVDRAGEYVVVGDQVPNWQLADLWHGWVELWLHIDPKAGNPQEVSTKNIGDGARTTISYKGWVKDRVARFEARRDLTKDEVWQLTKDRMLRAGLQDYQVAKITRSAEETMDVETEWPALRPRFAHSKKTVLFSQGADEREFIEEREYRFDWNSGEKARCP